MDHMDRKACFQTASETDGSATVLASVHNSALVRGVFTNGDPFFDEPKSCCRRAIRFARFLWITLLILGVEQCRSRAQQRFRRFALKKGSLLTLYKSSTCVRSRGHSPKLRLNLPADRWITVYVHKQGLQRKFSA